MSQIKSNPYTCVPNFIRRWTLVLVDIPEGKSKQLIYSGTFSAAVLEHQIFPSTDIIV